MSVFWTVFLTFLICSLALRLGFKDVLAQLENPQPDGNYLVSMSYLLVAAIVISICIGIRNHLL